MTVNVLNGTSVLEMGCTVAGLGSSIALISLGKLKDVRITLNPKPVTVHQAN